MKRILLVLVMAGITNLLEAQIFLRVQLLPGAQLEVGEEIFVAGNFNSWNPGDPKYKLVFYNEGFWQIRLENPASESLEYKFTRGSWDKVERDEEGRDIPNRSLTISAGQTYIDTIISWKPGQDKAPALNTSIIRHEIFMKTLDRQRTIRIYVPEDYDKSDRRWPVLYMHDGQNLFNEESSFSGEWRIDESLDSLSQAGFPACIVVGIDNGGAERVNEYVPWVHPKYGGGQGALYADFLVNELKPFVDSTYRTLPDFENTAIMGSSLGGYISLYTSIRHPGTFSKAGIFSPAFWIAYDIFDYMKEQGIPDSTRYYFVMGATEGMRAPSSPLMIGSVAVNSYISDMIEAYNIIRREDGDSNLYLKVVPGAPHHESFWRKAFPPAYQYLFESK